MIYFKFSFKKISLASAVFLAIAALPYAAFAQGQLYISPLSGTYRIGELFSILVELDTGGLPVNAASGQINFDNNKLEVESVGYSRSIFSIWTETPSFSNSVGTVRFSGGLPSPGYTGPRGAIVKITFKPIGVGQATVTLASGSVLLNDGKGTNILENLRGGAYNVLASVKPAAQPSEQFSGATFKVAEPTIAAPVVTDYPQQIEDGSILTIRGLGFPNGRVLVFVQKGAGDPAVEEVFAGLDGRFSMTYSKPVVAGFYRVWAKNVTPDGMISQPSEVVNIEVIQPLFFRIGNIAINYASIIVTLLALLVLAIIVIVWIWWRVRKWQAKRGKEISQAEKVLHDSLDRLKHSVGHYFGLLETKPDPATRRKKIKAEENIEEDIEDVEKEIKKEIEDIRRK